MKPSSTDFTRTWKRTDGDGNGRRRTPFSKHFATKIEHPLRPAFTQQKSPPISSPWSAGALNTQIGGPRRIMSHR